MCYECKCVRCGECNGSGRVWETFDGKYLGDHRSDDMDELICCPDCDGSGVTEYCDGCMKLEMDNDCEY